MATTCYLICCVRPSMVRLVDVEIGINGADRIAPGFVMPLFWVITTINCTVKRTIFERQYWAQKSSERSA